jgi:hypothetical protein
VPRAALAEVYVADLDDETCHDLVATRQKARVANYPSQVFCFPNGQTEAHHGDESSKEIIFPDGILRRVLPSVRSWTI